MQQFEYVIPFVGLIYGLCATELLTSLYRLLEQRKKVEFHVIPLLWALACFLMIINGWWGFFDINSKLKISKASQLLVLSLLPLLTFMFCATVLPRSLPNAGINMWHYFLSQRVIFFPFISLYLITIPLVMYSIDSSKEINYFNLDQWIFALLVFALSFIKNIWIHSLIVIVMLASLISTLNNQTLSIT
ncbi:hypothetical protein ACUR5C_04175 [Aliikangiella sp. IMCC44653]